MTFKKRLLALLAVVALLLSRAAFLFIHDSEGPNLVVVLGLAAIIYALLLLFLTLSSWARKNHKL